MAGILNLFLPRGTLGQQHKYLPEPLDHRRPTHSPLATCGECGEWIIYKYFKIVMFWAKD